MNINFLIIWFLCTLSVRGMSFVMKYNNFFPLSLNALVKQWINLRK